MAVVRARAATTLCKMVTKSTSTVAAHVRAVQKGSPANGLVTARAVYVSKTFAKPLVAMTAITRMVVKVTKIAVVSALHVLTTRFVVSQRTAHREFVPTASARCPAVTMVFKTASRQIPTVVGLVGLVRLVALVVTSTASARSVAPKFARSLPATTVVLNGSGERILIVVEIVMGALMGFAAASARTVRALVCSGDGQCAEPRCDDLVANGQETDVDCGGDCLPCADGLGCGAARDCISGVCTDALCQAPACDDGIQNGDEIGVDCGSECASCSCVGDAVTEIIDVGEFRFSTVDGPSFEASGCAQTDEAAEAVFRFTPPNDGVYCADTAGTEFDSVVYIRTDCSDPSSEVACNDSPDYPRVTDGRVHFAATAGEPIFIFVDAYSGLLTNLPSSGDAVLALTAGRCDGEPVCVGDADCGPGFSCDRGICVETPILCEGFGDCPFDKRCEDGVCVQIGAFACNRDDVCGENQRCVNAMCMDPPPTGSCLPDEIIDLDVTGRHDGSTAGAFATNNGTCAPSELSPEVVHRFRALEPGMHCVRTTGSGFNTVAYARFNCQQPFSETGCNDDSPLGGATSQFSFFAAVDQDTFIVVDGRDGELASQGDYSLTVSTGPCPECEVSAQCGPGQVCRGETCTFAPESGSILFTEVGFGDVGDRYIELHNQRNFDVNIGGCEIRVDGVSIDVDDFTIPSEGYVLIGEGRAISTGLAFEQNPSVELRCNDVSVHQVALNDPGFVQLGAGSLFLSADLETPDLSRQGGAWCRAEMGTPGLANPVCDRCAVTPCEGDDTRACRDNVQVVSRTECELVEGQIQNRCNEVVEETACPASCVDGRCVRAPSLGM